MAATDKVGIQADINSVIRSGLSDTLALDLRMILNEILDSYVNVKDGGLVYENPVGYNYLPISLAASAFVNKAYADTHYAGAALDLTAVLGNGSSTNNIPIFSATSITELKIDDSVSYLKFDDGFTHSGFYLSNAGIELLSDVLIYHDAPGHVFTATGDNVALVVRSPSGYYYPTIAWQNTGGVAMGSITGYGGALYIGGVGGVPLVVTGSNIYLPLINPNKLLYSNGAQNLAEVIMGARLSLTAGVLSVVTRVLSMASSSTPAINTDNYDAVDITALAAAITSMTTNLSGTAANLQKLIIRIKDNGTARAITWGAAFANKGGVLPTTTVIGKLVTIGLIYNTTTSLWECVAVSQEI